MLTGGCNVFFKVLPPNCTYLAGLNFSTVQCAEEDAGFAGLKGVEFVKKTPCCTDYLLIIQQDICCVSWYRFIGRKSQPKPDCFICDLICAYLEQC